LIENQLQHQQQTRLFKALIHTLEKVDLSTMLLLLPRPLF